MKTIIIDDDITAIELLADLLKQYEDVEIVGTATSGKEGLFWQLILDSYK